MEIAERKANLRGDMRMIRGNIDDRSRSKAAEALVYRLVNLPAVRHARCIGAYYACGSELSLQPAIETLREENALITVAYPLLVSEDTMLYVSFSPGDDMAVLERPATIVTDIPHERIVETDQLDIVLVPGLAFDAQGKRLGQGGGHFDRMLPHLKP